MLAVQCIIIFVSPFAAMGYEGVREALQLLFFAFTFLVCLLLRGLIVETLAILALICALTGFVLQLVAPSNASLILTYGGSISAFIVASYTLGLLDACPGRSDRTSGAGGDRALFEPWADVCRGIPLDLVFHSEFSQISRAKQGGRPMARYSISAL